MIKRILPFCLLSLLLSCSGLTPDTQEEGSNTTNEDLPAGYVPDGWEELPPLAYERSEYYPAEVIPDGCIKAPGLFVNSSTYSVSANSDKLLDFPSGGGTIIPDNSSVVSLGMAGGSVTVKFDPPIENHADNIGGYDFIVFGNAYWYGGNSSKAWQEPGVIWIMKDEDGDGVMNDTWYLIPGSHLSSGNSAENITYLADDLAENWWPDEAPSPLTLTSVFTLPDSLFSFSGTGDISSGYADVTPTLILGDMSGASGDSSSDNSIRNSEDYPEIDPVYFYTTPDPPGDRTIDAGSGGGDAIDMDWAVDPETFLSVSLDEISWIKIVGATTLYDETLGDYSPEIDGITRVRREN